MDKPRIEVGRFPRNAICAVTTSWDDSDSANMEIMRILESMNLKGTFYLDPGNPERGGLTDSQMRSLATRQEVGSHTWSHKNLKVCDKETVRAELGRSKDYIERSTRQPVLGVAYPYGEHSRAAERLARECNYLFARTIQEGHVDFPPRNPYEWGISVFADGKMGENQPSYAKLPSLNRLLSRRARLYYKNLTTDWNKLALRLFEKAQLGSGVWHLFGHASEVLRPELKSEFLEVCRRIAGKDGVWYATNGMLFLNDMVRRSLHISEDQRGKRFVFRIQVDCSAETLGKSPVPLRMVVPEWYSRDFKLLVTPRSGRFEMGTLGTQTWIDLFDKEGVVEIESG